MPMKITFVRGLLHDGAPPLWLMLIEPRSRDEAELLVRNAGAMLVWRASGHLYKDGGIYAHAALNAVAQVPVEVGMGKRDGFFLQRSGGMCKPLHKELERREVEVKLDRANPLGTLLAAWPTTQRVSGIDDVRFSQWPGGLHWYGRTSDGRDVEWDGECKWDSIEEARAAAAKFCAKPKSTKTGERPTPLSSGASS